MPCGAKWPIRAQVGVCQIRGKVQYFDTPFFVKRGIEMKRKKVLNRFVFTILNLGLK